MPDLKVAMHMARAYELLSLVLVLLVRNFIISSSPYPNALQGVVMVLVTLWVWLSN